jgi:hypothetical protein
MSAEDAAKKYDTNTRALEDQLRAAGMTKAQIDGLIGKYRNVPDTVNTNIALEGLTEAINDLDRMLQLINHITDPKSVDITINELVKTSSSPKATSKTIVGGKGHSSDPAPKAAPKAPAKPVAKRPGLATGGVMTGYDTEVGESGIELLHMPGAMVSSHPDTMARMQQASTAAAPVSLGIHFSGNTSNVFAQAFMKLVRTGAIQLNVGGKPVSV